jgi:predicted house-cleaning noncanonical NTP pyrophosphatase (MazG superfamily)
LCYDAEYQPWYPGAEIQHYDTYTTYTCTCSSYCWWSSRQMYGRRRAVYVPDEEAEALAEFVEEAAPLMAERNSRPSSKGKNVKTKQGKKTSQKGKNGRPLLCYDAEYQPWYPGAEIQHYDTYTTYTCRCDRGYCYWSSRAMLGRRRAEILTDEEFEAVADWVEEAAPLLAEKQSRPSSKGNVKTKQGKKTSKKGKNGRPLLCYDAEYQPWYPGAEIQHYDTYTTYTCTCSSYCFWSSRRMHGRRRAVVDRLGELEA